MISYAQVLKVNVDNTELYYNKHGRNQVTVTNHIAASKSSKKTQRSRDAQTLGATLEKEVQQKI